MIPKEKNRIASNEFFRARRLELRSSGLIAGVLASVLIAGCGSSGGGGAESQLPPGEMGLKPDGSGLYISEPHLNPGGSRLGLAQILLGRLVDVHDLDALGGIESEPVFRDMVVRQEIGSDGIDYLLEVDPVTQVTRLIVLRDADAEDNSAFRDLVLGATDGLPAIDPKADDGSDGSPFSMVPCNSALLLCFDDMLTDGAATAATLTQLVRVRSGYAPTQPFETRIFFERNFGAVAGDGYHSSRIVVDAAVSELEASQDGNLRPNAFGFPASLIESSDANVSIRIPTRTDQFAGQFNVLTNLRGRPLGTGDNGPVDFGAPTQPVMRGLRSGNEDDPGRGFLFDDVPPQLLGEWSAVVDSARFDPAAGPHDLLIDLTFPTACLRAPARGDLVETASVPLQVRVDGLQPDAQGRVLDLPVRALLGLESDALGGGLGSLLGAAAFVTPYASDLDLPDGCWARFLPEAGVVPAQDVAPGAVVSLRFSEPVDPRGLEALDGPALVRGEDEPDATSIAPRLARLNDSLGELQLIPIVGLPHAAGAAEEWRLLVTDAETSVIDLVGNRLAAAPGAIRFTLDPAAQAVDTGGVVLRFRDPDEYREFDQSEGARDLRGQFAYELERGLARPRPVQRQSFPVDQTQLLPSLMIPLPASTSEPLVPLGSKLQTLWRYADVGWLVNDESRVDLDVEGLAWAPFGGNVNADFYEGFEIRLGHGKQLPDETFSMGLLNYPSSGLLSAPNKFDDNFVQGRAGLSEIVHPRALGYLVDPADVYVSSSGTRLAPFPLNQTPGFKRTFTWRDTSVLSVGGAGGSGIPMQVETDLGLYPGLSFGSIATAGSVPSIGLPLLMEFRTKPDSSALGLNGFQAATARAAQLFPTFRVHSTGGFDVSGSPVSVDPDLQDIPNGGYDPNSTPPGLKSRPDTPSLYFGELQTVVRLSRAHSVWFDAGTANPDWGTPIVFPQDADQPGDARISLQFRGASSFVATSGAEVDASRLDLYGDVDQGQVLFANGDPTWKDSIHELVSARYVQVRFTFENDIEADVSPALDALILSFER